MLRVRHQPFGVVVLGAVTGRVGHCECKCVNQTLQLDGVELGDRLQLVDGRRERLQLVGGGCVCATSNCVRSACAFRQAM
jgi:hypothetical protein